MKHYTIQVSRAVSAYIGHHVINVLNSNIASKYATGVKTSLAGLVLLGLLTSWPAQAAAQAATCVSPSSAADFAASFGVNTHFHQGYQYSDVAKTVSALQDLGIGQVRDNFSGLGQSAYEYAASKGIKFVFIISGDWGDKVVPALEAWNAKYPGSILAIEGPNEVNNWPITYKGLTGIPAAQEYQRMLYDGVKASPDLRNIPVLSLTSWPTFQNKSDIGNIHPYAKSGESTTRAIEEGLAGEGSSDPPKEKIWITEGGYHTLLGGGYFEGVSEPVQAKLILSLYISAFSHGVDRTFLYQFLDQYTDLTDQQAHFGIIDLDWREKPAFVAVKNTLAILRNSESAGAKVQPQPLDYKVEGLPSDARQKLLQTDAGDWILAIWSEAAIWDKENDVEVTRPEHEAVLKLQSTHPTIAVFDPIAGTEPIQAKTDTDSVSFPFRDHLVFVKIGGKPSDGSSPPSCVK